MLLAIGGARARAHRSADSPQRKRERHEDASTGLVLLHRLESLHRRGERHGPVCCSGGGVTPPPHVDAGPPPAVDVGGPAKDAGGGGPADCNTPGLTWHSANKTTFDSYPDPGSPECIQYNGCAYEGGFAACNKTESKAWVSSHNIVSVFPNLGKASQGIGALALHGLCLKSGSKSIVVTVLDECADSDCSGCCTQNKGSAEELIDIESFTDARWGVDDGPIQWADLGPTKTAGCNGGAARGPNQATGLWGPWRP
jgi:hypothetical protein